MRGLVAIAGRELAEKWPVLVAAAVAAVLPFGAPLLPGVEAISGADARDAAAVMVGGAFTAMVALGFGASLFGVSGHNRGLGFFLSRPTPGLAVWFGRALPVAMLAALCGAIIFIPAWLVGGVHLEIFATTGRSARIPGPDVVTIAILLGLLVIVAVATAHWLALNYRQRSLLLVADFAAGALAVQVWWLQYRPLRQLGVDRPEGILVVVAVASVMAGLVVASASAVVRGRVELGAARWGASIGLWAILAASVPALTGFVGWVANPSPADFRGSVSPSSGSSWVALHGRARLAYVTFLYDTRTGRSVRACKEWCGHLDISGHGEVAGWFAHGSAGREYVTLDLTDPSPGPVPSEAISRRANGDWFPVRLSPDGRLALVLDDWRNRALTLVDLVEDRVVFEHTWPDEGARTYADFTSSTEVTIVRVVQRVYRLDYELQLFTLDLRDRELREHGQFGPCSETLFTGTAHIAVDPTGRHLLVASDGRALLVTLQQDAPPIATDVLVAHPPAEVRGGFLADGRILVGTHGHGPTRLSVFDSTGVELAHQDLPSEDDGFVTLGGEAEPGRVVVAAGGYRNTPTTFLFDVDAMTAHPIGTGLRPVARMDADPRQGLGYRGEPGTPATRLLETWSDGWKLLRLDPDTGQLEEVLGR